ncbi:MAG: hypothetical protein QM519_01395 [Bacteroidia bacterium]|nr:hypothetical protein [Bacteroidia bacterium]
MFEDEETLGGLTAAEQGDEMALDYQNPADVARAIQRSSLEQKAYYDSLAEQLKAKRYGPTASERLFALSAAFAAPTSTRGFGGVMSNVMPVFQQFEKSKREAEEARAEDMQKLQMARMGATQAEIKSALDLQRLQATYAKAGQPKMTYAEGDWRIQPGTGGVPPLNAKGQYVVSSKEQAASVPKGKQFVWADGDPNDVYYGQ